MRERLQSVPESTGVGRRISVAMATYNGEKYISEQLDSIASQDLLPIELVITDDGSTDRTLQIIGEFARLAPFPVRVFRNEPRLGYADNFLKAASLCEGDLIAFCDQDDIWTESKLKTCSRFFEDPNVMLTIHSAQTIGSSGKAMQFPRLSTTRVWGACDVDPFASGPGFAMVIRSDLLSMVDNNLRPARLRIHDQWIWFLAVCSGKVATIAVPLALYRQHGSNVFGAPRQKPLTERTAIIANTLAYDKFAEFEFASSKLLRSAAEARPHRSEQLRRSADLLEFRAKLHLLRREIYNRESRLTGRAIAFARISILGGYWPDRSSTRLGPRAAFKDMLFGVPGVYKLLLS